MHVASEGRWLLAILHSARTSPGRQWAVGDCSTALHGRQLQSLRVHSLHADVPPVDAPRRTAAVVVAAGGGVGGFVGARWFRSVVDGFEVGSEAVVDEGQAFGGGSREPMHPADRVWIAYRVGRVDRSGVF